MQFIDLHTCIQGEGRLAGVPHILARVTGCNLKCVFKHSICDTPYSSHSPEKATFDYNDLVKLIKTNRQIRYIMLTGGEPTIHPKIVANVVDIAKTYGMYITIETNATRFLEVDYDKVTISMSPKLSTSGNPVEDSIKIDVIQKYIALNDTQLKFVVTGMKDLIEISSLHKEVGCSKEIIYLMPEGVTKRQLAARRKIVEAAAISFGYNYTDRLHILIHGEKRDA